MGMQHVSQWPPLVHLRMQILQIEDVQTVHQQSLSSLSLSFPHREEARRYVIDAPYRSSFVGKESH
jgi:hypothetical protein